MRTTRRTIATSVVAMLAGTLALGACGEGQTNDDASPQLDQAAVEAAADAAAVRAQAQAQQLKEVRQTSPTAGMEVPPATLATKTGALTVRDSWWPSGTSVQDRWADAADTLREGNTHTGIPRADGADIGWPDRAEEPRGLEPQGRYPRYVE